MYQRNRSAPRKAQIEDKSNPIKSPHSLQAYYKLEDAVNFAKIKKPNVPLTSETIVHYAAAELIQLFTPVQSTLRLVLIDKGKVFTGFASSLNDRPTNSPDMLVLDKNDCIEIEVKGKTEQSDFQTGYTYFKGTLHETHIAGSGWAWRTICDPHRQMDAAEGGDGSPAHKKPLSHMGMNRRSISAPLDLSLEMEGFNSQGQIVKHYPKTFELNKKNILISRDALNWLIQQIDDEIKRNDANNNQQNLSKIISSDSVNVLGNTGQNHGSEAHNPTLTTSSESQNNEIHETAKANADHFAVIGKVKTVQVEIRTKLGRKNVTICKYLPQQQRPPVLNEFEIPEQTKVMLVGKSYRSLAEAAEITKRTEDKLLELGGTGDLGFITPVPNGIYLHPVDEKTMSWNTKPKNVPKFLVLDKLDCKEIVINDVYKQKNFKNGCDLCSGKAIHAYLDESNSESACVWRTFSHLAKDRDIVITRDRVYIKHSDLTQLIETKGKSDHHETKSEGNDAANEQQKKKGGDESHSESSGKSTGLSRGFYTMKEVMGLTKYSRSTINEKTKVGHDHYAPDFPRKIHLSDKPSGKVGFDVTEVDAWIETRKSKR